MITFEFGRVLWKLIFRHGMVGGGQPRGQAAGKGKMETLHASGTSLTKASGDVRPTSPPGPANRPGQPPHWLIALGDDGGRATGAGRPLSACRFYQLLFFSLSFRHSFINPSPYKPLTAETLTIPCFALGRFPLEGFSTKQGDFDFKRATSYICITRLSCRDFHSASHGNAVECG